MNSNNNTHAWPATARLGSMSDAAQAEDEAHPYDAYSGFNDPDSGLETDKVLPHAWPPLNKKLAGGISDQSIDFKAADKRAPRNPGLVQGMWGVYQAARDAGLTHEQALKVGDCRVADILTLRSIGGGQ